MLGVVAVVVLLTLFLSIGTHAESGTESPPIALGVVLPNGAADPVEIDAFSEQIGRMPSFLMWYEGWASGEFGEKQRTDLENVVSRGMDPMITWSPWDPLKDPVDQAPYRLRNITRGDFDALIDSWAHGLAAFGRPVYLSFAHEMNGNWYPWGARSNGNSPADFIAAWRYVHHKFDEAGATNVRWVWTVNHEYQGMETVFSEVYPGDDYVDWVGLNGFNWGTSTFWPGCCPSTWNSFEDIFGYSYERLVLLTSKPIMIAESASVEEGGDKAAWIYDTFRKELPQTFPRIRAFVWFNLRAGGTSVSPTGETSPQIEVDWSVDSSDASLRAFRLIANSLHLQGTFSEAEVSEKVDCLQRNRRTISAWLRAVRGSNCP